MQYTPMSNPYVMSRGKKAPVVAPAPAQPANAQPAEMPVFDSAGNLLSQNLMNNYQNAYNAAKNANLHRYNDILAGYNQRKTDVMNSMEGMNQQAASDIRTDYDAMADSQAQKLRNAGLAGTTVMPTMIAGVEKQKQAQLNRLNEATMAQKTNALAGLEGDTLKFQENRNDVYPDTSLYASLLQNAGKYGATNNGTSTSVPTNGAPALNTGTATPTANNNQDYMTAYNYLASKGISPGPVPKDLSSIGNPGLDQYWNNVMKIAYQNGWKPAPGYAQARSR